MDPPSPNPTLVRTEVERPSTPAEAAFCGFLDSLGGGVLVGQYRREVRIDRWIVDFFFPGIGLVIEIDGGYHRALWQKRRDHLKTTALGARGYTILRVTNGEVAGDREALTRRLRAAWREASERRALHASRVAEPAVQLYCNLEAVRVQRPVTLRSRPLRPCCALKPLPTPPHWFSTARTRAMPCLRSWWRR